VAHRMHVPTVHYVTDSMIDAIKGHDFTTPYAVFAHAKSIQVPKYEPLCLWSQDTKVVVPLTRGGGVSVIPCEVRYAIDKQVYDYPYIAINKSKALDKRQDVIFLSNGEPNALQNWEHLKSIAPHAKHISGVNGRSEAYKAAAEASDTPWFFTVFAKLRMNDDFDWDWQPDRLQQAKHYIFYARNPVNNLEYGHMGLIVYNKDLTLRTKQEDIELDFTLAALLEVVPITAGVAEFNTDPYNTWRAAFREVVKLKHYTMGVHGYEAELRLDTWLKVANDVPNAQWALQGAYDAIHYYEEVKGELSKLKLSYEWSWLADFWSRKNYAPSWQPTPLPHPSLTGKLAN